MKFETTDCIAILGGRGSGKTTLSRKIQKAWPRQVVLDPVREYDDGEIVNSFSEFKNKILEFDKNKSKKFRLIVRFSEESEDLSTDLDAILRVLYHFKNVQIIIDEVQVFTSSHQIPLYLKNCIFLGRHKGISLIFITQRPARMHKDILSQCQHVFAGLIHEKNDWEYLRPTFGDFAEKLPNMPKGKFLYFSPGKPITEVENGYRK